MDRTATYLSEAKGHYKPDGFDRPLELDEQPCRTAFRHGGARFQTDPFAVLIRFVFLPLWVISRIRCTGELLWAVNRPHRNHRDTVVITRPTAAEVVSFERQAAAMLRRLRWGVRLHLAASTLVAIDLLAHHDLNWFVTIWQWMTVIVWLRFEVGADKLADDIRRVHTEHHGQDRARFPFASGKTFPKIRR